jgi:hypothetical protein
MDKIIKRKENQLPNFIEKQKLFVSYLNSDYGIWNKEKK